MESVFQVAAQVDNAFFRVDGSRQKQKAQTGIRDLRILVRPTIFRSRHNIKTLSGERLNMMCPGSARAAEIEMSIRSSDSEKDNFVFRQRDLALGLKPIIQVQAAPLSAPGKQYRRSHGK
jgi:hypothetical protein